MAGNGIENIKGAMPEDMNELARIYPYNLVRAVLGDEFDLFLTYVPGVYKAMESLMDIEREILKYVFKEGWTLRKIGEIYKHTGSWAEQMKERAIRKMKYPSRYKLFTLFKYEMISPEPVDSAILNADIEELGLSLRAYNCLKRYGIKTIGDLVILTPEELMDIRNMGKNSRDDIIIKLRFRGLHLKKEDGTIEGSTNSEVETEVE